ncbi:protein NO VEIN domain-containing protein [Micromonospora sp. MS34]|uniref:protein NO VEIN domain-containing protein n=1 Tax=Micromonospora sp. MS34 TaxID=3385971 RepID=UPI0039A3E7FF
MRAGDPEFEQAVEASVAILREAARRSRDDSDALVTYRQLSDLLAQHGLQVPYHGGPMPYILEEASLREHAADRGMVSALVVKQGPDGNPTIPSGGFYRMARRRPFGRKGVNDEIWLNEVRRLRAENAPVESSLGAQADRSARHLVTTANLGAWLVKCNPDVWDLAGFLADGGETITSWSVVPTYRAELIRAGQKVLFWVTGRDGGHLEPGLWGAGVALGPVYDDEGDDDSGYWLDEDQLQRTHHFAPMDVRLLPYPVPRSVLKSDRRLTDMEIFRQPQMGNPLFVTKEQLAAIEEHLPEQPATVTVTATGAGFGNPVTNAEVEAAAMDAVAADYEGRGWAVKDVSKECLGWDLTCTSRQGKVDKVEVKGVSGLIPKVLLTRNEERSAREDAGWRLAVVTKALVEPTLHFFDADTTVSAATPFVFQVDLRQAGPTVPDQRERRADPSESAERRPGW